MSRDEFEEGRKMSILRAAEAVFADNSYEGASIRTIASRAGVNPALVGYYFGTKSELYAEIISGRYRDITEERDRLLDEVPRDLAGRPAVEAILRAWFGPFVSRLDSPDGETFVRLLTREVQDPAHGERGVVETILNPSAARCLERLAAALPDATPSDVAWGYQFAIAIMLSSVTGADRTQSLSSDDLTVPEGRELLDTMVEFAASGLVSLVERRANP
ncbi:MAG: TetR family transcriptional regulator [Alphaproteobacteria bacterium]|nr:TetR family transcriptional regulator [Alphaproteobacteria bacterium]